MKLISNRELQDLLGSKVGTSVYQLMIKNANTTYKKRNISGLAVHAYRVATMVKFMKKKRNPKTKEPLWYADRKEIIMKLLEWK